MGAGRGGHVEWCTHGSWPWRTRRVVHGARMGVIEDFLHLICQGNHMCPVVHFMKDEA